MARVQPRVRAAHSCLLGALAALPFLVGFDLVHSRSPFVEEGNARMKAGKPDEALAAYDKAVAELPGEPGAHFDRGTALAALSRFDEAGQEFLRATEARDASLKEAAFYNLGNAFFKKDKFKEAIEAYKRALALNPKDANAKWNLEIALAKKRDDDEKKKKDKDKDKDKDKNKQDQKKPDDKQDKDKDKDKTKPDKPDPKDPKEDQKKQSDGQDKKPEPPPPKPDDKPRDKPDDKPPEQREIESVLDGLEKSPKDLEKQRARMRAVRRAPPTRDW
jgi:tetratricopeptide (TPR) repeat protein